jgi:hypothetical protein
MIRSELRRIGRMRRKTRRGSRRQTQRLLQLIDPITADRSPRFQARIGTCGSREAEAYILALSKLERNLRSAGEVERHDPTLGLWIETLRERSER